MNSANQKHVMKAKDKLCSMTVAEKVGQLLVIRPNSEDFEGIVAKGMVGGVYMPSDVSADVITEIRKIAPIPLIIAQDLESGITCEGPSWPSAMSVSALHSKEAGYEWAYLQALQARSFGVNAAFGPVFDLGINRYSEHTGIRSIGSDPDWVAALGCEFVKGYQDAGILPFAKHFPGFGRGLEDPHMELSNLDADSDTIWNEELLPYREAISKAGLMGIMSGHVMAPAIDPDVPSTYSAGVLGILDRMEFKGLVITDSLSMLGILQYDNTEEIYPRAITAGNDMILANIHIDDIKGYECLMKAVRDGRITTDMLDGKVMKILTAKYFIEEFNSVPCSGRSPENCQVPDVGMLKKNNKLQKVLPDYPAAYAAYNEAQNEKTFIKMSENSMTYYRRDGGDFKPFLNGQQNMIIVASEEALMIKGELSDGRSPAQVLMKSLREQYPDCRIIKVPLCPGRGNIYRVLEDSLDCSDVMVIAQTLVGCYTGTDHYQKPLISMIRALKNKISSFIVWGNPYAALDMPAGLPQYVFVYDRGPWAGALMKLMRGEIYPRGTMPVKLEWNKE